MKKFIFSLALLILVASVPGQTPTTRAQSQEELLTKARNLNTLATVALFPGIVLIGAGLVMDKGKYTPGFITVGEYENQEKKQALVAGGVALIIGSIATFVVSSKIKRKATRISVNSSSLLLPKGNNLVLKEFPTLTLKIAL